MKNDWDSLDDILGVYLQEAETFTTKEERLRRTLMEEMTVPATKIKKELGVDGIKMEKPIELSTLRKAHTDTLLDTYNSNAFLYNLTGDMVYDLRARECLMILQHRAKEAS
jgi:hypothetical protein